MRASSRAPTRRLSYLTSQIPLLIEATWFAVARSLAVLRSFLAQLFFDPEAMGDRLIDDVWAEEGKPGTGRSFRCFQLDELRWKGMKTHYMDQWARLIRPPC